MKMITLQGRVGEDHKLTADAPPFLPAGQFELKLLLPDPVAADAERAEEEAEWAAFVAQGLSRELSDPREDIYQIKDGVPIDHDLILAEMDDEAE